MLSDTFNTFCASLLATTHVVQWGGADVWKVGGKVFAIGGWSDNDVLGITFKVSPMAFDLLSEIPGLRPAPYFANRGMKWIQRYGIPGFSDEILSEHLEESYYLVASGLTKKKCKELGILLRDK